MCVCVGTAVVLPAWTSRLPGRPELLPPLSVLPPLRSDLHLPPNAAAEAMEGLTVCASVVIKAQS